MLVILVDVVSMRGCDSWTFFRPHLNGLDNSMGRISRSVADQLYTEGRKYISVAGLSLSLHTLTACVTLCITILLDIDATRGTRPVHNVQML